MTDLNISKYGTLYIVATPIGNMKDITINALEILNKVDKVICEDTRVTSKLLSYHGISKPLYQYHDHSQQDVEDKIISWLRAGDNLALVSDAGTPLISDPGYGVVRQAIDHDINVTTIPGACSAICALTASGIPSNKFIFYGFLPTSGHQRRKELLSLKELHFTIIFFESAKRVIPSLSDMLEVLGNRKISISRELTKRFEETKRGNIEELIQYYSNHPPKGELIIVIKGNDDEAIDLNDLEKILKNLLPHMSLKDAVHEISTNMGVNKKQVYDIALRIK